MKLLDSEFPDYFRKYIVLADHDVSIARALDTSFTESMSYLETIEESQKDHAYAKGKWTVGQVFQHMIDVELVMAHRAFRIARTDEINLPGFDHNTYAEVADVSHKSLAQLLGELNQVREVTKMHFASLDEEGLKRFGTVSGNAMSVRALGYICIGHIEHHIKLFKERYF